jgi:hypothetical protein
LSSTMRRSSPALWPKARSGLQSTSVKPHRFAPETTTRWRENRLLSHLIRTERQIESQRHTPQVDDLTTKHLRELAVSVFYQDATSQ